MTVKIGDKFGKLTVLAQDGSDSYYHRIWECECECGRHTKAVSRQLLGGKKRSCGCLSEISGPENKNWKGYQEISLSLWNKWRIDARKRNLSWNISMSMVWSLFELQERKCKLSGLPLTFGRGKMDTDRTASLDRIDSSKGYEDGNIQWVHKDINRMKQHFPEKQFLELVEDIYKHQHRHD